MTTLVACPCCARHIRPNEPACPFCGLTLEQASRGETGTSPWYAIAALSTTLVLSGCPNMMVRYGGPPQPETPARIAQPNPRETADIYGAPPPPVEQTTDSGVATGPNDPGGMVEAYGAPPPPNTSNRDR
ncbi:MAG: hypothetical protein JNK05_05905 [Myxococcales bacterium]|jgi:hypothetical protein|nr:hypothetical protein [Myxococcales bacterium]